MVRKACNCTEGPVEWAAVVARRVGREGACWAQLLQREPPLLPEGAESLEADETACANDELERVVGLRLYAPADTAGRGDE